MQIVKVRLRKPRRVLPFLCGDNFKIDRDDHCIVESDHGPEWGMCVLPPEPCPSDVAERHSMRLLRRATPADFKNMEALMHEERRARRVCLEKIERRNLPMKLVDVEFSFDQKKATFFFTADERVDFRELVRDLAHELRMRIELRHIQVRDEAKLVGGLGSCGRALCCASWLNEFKPISMRMAKRQNLSLNPTKISGQCGRLLCCLAYENELYDKGRCGKKEAAAAQTGRIEDDEEVLPFPEEDTPADIPADDEPEFPEESPEPARAPAQQPAAQPQAQRPTRQQRPPRRRRGKRPRR
ncbi:MAG TPA: stage 0 sporulation protein [Candidatus Hydrogenedentes bacterium]|nr:stage 0 sporulation protein [Candidatus Hydrogenedentota bacterium]